MGDTGGDTLLVSRGRKDVSAGRARELLRGDSCEAAIAGASHRTSFAQSSSVYVWRRISI